MSFCRISQEIDSRTHILIESRQQCPDDHKLAEQNRDIVDFNVDHGLHGRVSMSSLYHTALSYLETLSQCDKQVLPFLLALARDIGIRGHGSLNDAIDCGRYLFLRHAHKFGTT